MPLNSRMVHQESPPVLSFLLQKWAHNMLSQPPKDSPRRCQIMGLKPSHQTQPKRGPNKTLTGWNPYVWVSPTTFQPIFTIPGAFGCSSAAAAEAQGPPTRTSHFSTSLLDFVVNLYLIACSFLSSLLFW